jgi:hypothetical protein
MFECWTLGVLIQAIRGKPGISSQEAGLHQPSFDILLIVLSSTRIVNFVMMIFAYRSRKTPIPNTASGETSPLLDGGGDLEPLAYGTTRQRLIGKPSDTGKPRDAQTTEWTDYVLGFRKLFPFLWLVTPWPSVFAGLVYRGGCVKKLKQAI